MFLAIFIDLFFHMKIFDIVLSGSKKRWDSDRHYITNITEYLIFQQDFIISFIYVLHVSCSIISKYFIIPIMNFYITDYITITLPLITDYYKYRENIHL